jgi:hypothetical protein
MELFSIRASGFCLFITAQSQSSQVESSQSPNQTKPMGSKELELELELQLELQLQLQLQLYDEDERWQRGTVLVAYCVHVPPTSSSFIVAPFRSEARIHSFSCEEVHAYSFCKTTPRD